VSRKLIDEQGLGVSKELGLPLPPPLLGVAETDEET